MKKKYSSLLIILALSFSIVQVTHAEDTVPEIIQLEVTDTPTSTPEEVTENQVQIPEETITTSTEDTATEAPLDLSTTTAKLYAIANGSILFNQTITVTACKPYEAAIEYTLNAKCLIDQATGLTSTWNYFGTDAFLDSVNGVSNNFGANLFWGYFINLEYASVALNAYTLHEGDEILIQYNTVPLKLEISNTAPQVGDSEIVSVFEFGLDEFWNPVWLPSSSSTLTVNGVANVLTSSTYALTIPSTSTQLRVEKNGYVTQETTLTATEVPIVTPPTSENTSGSGGGSSTPDPTQSLINFLDAKQNTDGSFGGSAFLSDWAAVAYSAWIGEQTGKSKLSTYLLTDPNPLDGPNHTTNYARRAMGLMSLGINPYTGTKTNYIQSILNGYDGTQFGDVGLINDDIFALIPLEKAGYTAQDAQVINAVKNILANQTANGSFGSVDLTAAAIQALAPVSSLNGVTDALTKAKNYLHTSQQNDGGFNNVYTTSWAIQAISALGENQANWTVNENTPLSYTIQNQGTDGGLLTADIQTNRIWATTYAVPAVLGKSWNTILISFSKPSTAPQVPSGSGAPQSNTTTSTTTATSTTQTTTSTITTTEVVTSTITTSTIQQITIEPQIAEIVSTPEITYTQTSYREPLVLGERITDPEIIEDTSVISTSTIENADQNQSDTKEDISEPKKSNMTKYIFLASLILFLGLIGYMGIRGKVG